jgi:hypothetical protein
MISLYNLVQSNLLKPADHLFFLYKSFTFTSQVNSLGVLYNFKCNGKVVFTERLPFDSLSIWADTCIQELANEYVTRFSSFKRTKHLESGLSLNTIRQLYSQFVLPKTPVTSNSIAAHRQYISSLSRYCKKLENSLTHWERYFVGKEKRPPETIHFKPSALKTILALEDQYRQDKTFCEGALQQKRKRRKKSCKSAIENSTENAPVLVLP